MTEFVIYMGIQKEVTVSGLGLSKVYRFEKAIPALVDNLRDKYILLNYKEVVRSACCGNKSNTFPFMEDTLYCKYQNQDVDNFRNKWVEYWNKQNGK
jgi:hypothetical protein